jgi:5-methylcytosine-specific restriction endonuclease McrA
MSENPKSFRVLLTKSRLEKGLLAISRKFRHLFPPPEQRLTVFFDDEVVPQLKPSMPYESTTRECRIYNLRKWFQKHRLKVGDWVEVIVKATGYQLIFRKRTEEEARYRQELQGAATEEQATEALHKLAQTQRCSARRAAIKERECLARQPWERKRVTVAPRERYEGVSASLRALLKAIYEGRCQICEFTFQKRNGEPYFEVHHIDPDDGHQPQNLLVLCANCHAQMEHAEVRVKRDENGWVVAVIVNGEEKTVHQALLVETRLPSRTMLFAFFAICWFLSEVAKLRQIV